jgi:hypothetical protein
VLFGFGDSARFCRTVWRSVLQNNRHLTYAASHDEGAAIAADRCAIARAFRGIDAALSLPHFPSTALRILGICRCEVQEANLISARL